MDLKRILNDYGIDLENEKVERIERFLEFLKSSKINLTSIEPEEMPHKIVADTLVPLLDFPIDDDFIDVGTGGGIPGVVISIAHDVGGVLLDSTKKKIDAVRKFVESEDLPLELVWKRAEELAHEKGYRESFLYVVSRALAETRIALELTAPFATVGGYVLLYKGKGWKEELDRAQKAMEILGLDLGDVLEYELRTGEKRSLLIFEKIYKTPRKYPRRAGIPSKRPLG